jgi:energy-converting hydrogenase Eha subunit C
MEPLPMLYFDPTIAVSIFGTVATFGLLLANMVIVAAIHRSRKKREKSAS